MIDRDYVDLIGKTLRAAAVVNDGDRLELTLDDGTVAEFDTYGDCCSTTWIEHMDAPPDLAGAKLLTVIESDTVPDDECRVDHASCKNADVLAVYRTTFRTDRGDITVEYRNDSNGYYGGSLERVRA